MRLKNSRAVVTGAGGFIGSHLVESLVEKGSKVIALAHYNSRNDWGKLEELPREILERVEVVSGDIRDPFFVNKITRGADAVFHLAAAVAIPFSYVAPEHYIETNVKGTLNIMEAARANKISKIIHTSTSEVYGTAHYTPIDEKHPLVGQSPYSASKIAADKLVESYHLSFGLPVVTVRPFNTFGPR
ncbi:MAG: SDR family NAD(P)-dependent oxidoreductase, partial [Endomicrobiia bacterium]|nr:SDR family NAD(P)-dependent oxidoreductase [Endomicrobiia bacterium]